MTVVNKEYIDLKSSVPAKLSKNTETPQKPVKSPSKIAQRKRKLVQKSLQNTTILSENLDPDVNNSRDEKLYFWEFEEKNTVTYQKNPLGQKFTCRTIENTEIIELETFFELVIFIYLHFDYIVVNSLLVKIL